MQYIQINDGLIKLARDSKSEKNITASINMGLLFISLVSNEKPKLIVEIGSYLGFSACCFAIGLANNNSGEIYTIDNAKDKTMRTIKNAKELGLDKYITALTGDGISVIKETTLLRNIDLLFIDGDHSEQSVYRDLSDGYKYVRNGGLIIMHDYGAKECHNGINKALVVLESMGYKFHILPVNILTGGLLIKKVK